MDVRRRLATPEELRQGQEEMQKAQERMQSEAGRLGEDPIEDVKATEDSKVGEEKTVVEVGRVGMVGESIPISTPPSGSQSRRNNTGQDFLTTDQKPPFQPSSETKGLQEPSHLEVQTPGMSAPAMSPQLPLFDEEQLRAFAHLQSQAAWLYGGSQVGGFIPTVPRPLSLEMEERDSMLRRLNLLQERLDQEQREKVQFQKEVKDILEENRRLKEEVKFLEDPGRETSPFCNH